MSALVQADGDTRRAIVQQVTMGVVLSISGGRIHPTEHGVSLPVDAGYSVRISYTADDTYLVERVYRRGFKEWVKGTADGVYCDQLAEVAYRAGMFRSFGHDEWAR